MITWPLTTQCIKWMLGRFTSPHDLECTLRWEPAYDLGTSRGSSREMKYNSIPSLRREGDTGGELNQTVRITNTG